MIQRIKQCAYLAIFSFCSAQALAVTPTPAMMEQFKQLPRAEQEKLAKQYGIDLNQLNSASSQQPSRTQVSPLTPNPQFDARQNEAMFVAEDQQDGKPKRFGLNLFNAQISTFAPVDNAPVPDNYLLGPDDTLLVQLYGKQSSSEQLTIGRDGQVQLDNVGPVTIAGLTFTEAAALIKARVEEANIGVQASVSMGQLRSINVFIAGEAKYPGMYAVSAMTTVTQALFVAGGISDIGSLRDIRIQRSGNQIGRFDLYDLLLKGDNSGDSQLRHGDVVFVAPLQAVVEIGGEVNRPAIYEVKAGETVQDLLRMAGGAKPNAHIKDVVMERINRQGVKQLSNLDLTSGASLTSPLQNGDMLQLAAISNRVENEVVLAGAVVRPGRYAYKTGMQLKDLIRGVWTDLLPTVDLDYALILREKNSRGDIEVIQVNLVDALALDGGFSTQRSIQLQPRDVVIAFHAAIEKDDVKDLLEQQAKEKRQKQLDNLRMSALYQTNQQQAGQQNLTVSPNEPASENELQGTGQQQKSKYSISSPFEFDTKQQNDAQQKALKDYLAKNYKAVFTEKVLLEQTPKLNREQMLIPVLEKLKQQATNSTPLAIASAYGDVKVPGDYPIAKNAGVQQLIAAAGGLKDSAYLQRAELSRLIGQSSTDNQILVKNFNLNLTEPASIDSDVSQLQSRDRLNVFSMPDWSVDKTVELTGEVRFPGTYQVTKGETLSQLIERAGGFTDAAFPFGAIFTREKIQKREQEQFERLLMQLKSDVASKSLTSQGPMSSSPEQSVMLINQLSEQKMLGRLVLNMTQIQAGNPEYDLEVDAGDKLFIPRRNSAISVVGEVQNPGSHSYNPNLTVKEYLALSGNSRKRADNERVYVLRADGSVVVPSNSWFAGDQTLMPGDTIVVPLDVEYKDGLTLWSQITQIFYQSAVAIAALNSF